MHNMYSNWRWTKLTAFCYDRNMICKDCPEQLACSMGEGGRVAKKLYGLKNVKEAVLATYRAIGKKGLERFGYDTRDE